MGDESRFRIRIATGSEVDDIARLSRQLGYPVEPVTIRPRLELILQATDKELYVGWVGESVAGWLEVEARTTLETGQRAEIVGLVVDEAQRRRGIGRGLVEAARQWAQARGLRHIRVRTNVVREGAAGFYRSLGFIQRKTQRVFDAEV